MDNRRKICHWKPMNWKEAMLFKLSSSIWQTDRSAASSEATFVERSLFHLACTSTPIDTSFAFSSKSERSPWVQWSASDSVTRQHTSTKQHERDSTVPLSLLFSQPRNLTYALRNTVYVQYIYVYPLWSFAFLPSLLRTSPHWFMFNPIGAHLIRLN